MLPLGQAQIFRPGVASRSRVVDQDVYRSDRVSDRRECRLNRPRVTGVAADEDGLAPLGTKFAGRSFPACASMSSPATRAPARANAAAVARPIPAPKPVITASRPPGTKAARLS